MNKLKAVWSSLPHPVQALILAFATTAATTFIHALSEGNCFTVVCLKHFATTSLAAGAVAARAFYMVPNGRGSAPQAPPQPPPDTTVTK